METTTPLTEWEISRQGEGQEPAIITVKPELDQNKTSTYFSEIPEIEKAPDGGATAWLVAAGGSAIFFCCLGFSNAFGTFQEYYITHQLRHKSIDSIAWIGSTSAFLQFVAGIIGGPLFDRFGAKVTFYSPCLYFI